MEPIFKKDPPEKDGFYWWKKYEHSDPQVIMFEVGTETYGMSKEESHTVYIAGQDVPVGLWMGYDLGLFGPEVTLITESQEDEND